MKKILIIFIAVSLVSCKKGIITENSIELGNLGSAVESDLKNEIALLHDSNILLKKEMDSQKNENDSLLKELEEYKDLILEKDQSIRTLEAQKLEKDKNTRMYSDFFGVGEYRVDSYSVISKEGADYDNWEGLPGELFLETSLNNSKMRVVLKGIKTSRVIEAFLTADEYRKFSGSRNDLLGNEVFLSDYNDSTSSYTVIMTSEEGNIILRVDLSVWEMDKSGITVINEHKYSAVFNMSPVHKTL